MEDVILYHVLHDCDNIFYIDIGCNDPIEGSVTKFLYDKKNAHGINVDPQPECVAATKRDRPRDITLCVGVGKERKRETLYIQGERTAGTSTMIKKNVKENYMNSYDVEVVTLSDICYQYVSNEQEISFLKIDVEGAEKDVLLGGDFQTYRPWIIVIESTIPCTSILNYQEWENIVTTQGYHFVYMKGINRYYVANEKSELDQNFISWDRKFANYCIYHIGLPL